MHGTDEPGPVVVACEAPRQPRVCGGGEDRAEGRDRERGDAQRQEGVIDFAERRPEQEPGHDQRGE